MKGTWFMMCLCLTIVCADGRRRRKHDDESEDFEFADDSQNDYDYQRDQLYPWEKNSGSVTPKSDVFIGSTTQPTESIKQPETSYCSVVRCPVDSTCILKGHTAVCVSDSRNERSNSVDGIDNNEDEHIKEQETKEEENFKDTVRCTLCPVAKPRYVCGSDNNTYSSVCRLNYHNCVQNMNVHVMCMNFCPCTGQSKLKHGNKLEKVNHHWNKFVNKYKLTVSKLAGGRQTENKSEKSGALNLKSKTEFIQNSDDETQKQHIYNSVLPEKTLTNTFKKKDCSQQDFDIMGNRLLDWFTVVISDTKRNKSRRKSYGLSPAIFPGYCKEEIKLMFHHLDQNSDAYLSLKELYDLEHESHEYCLKPFLERCDVNKNLLVSSQEWCKCFDRTERPCIAARTRAHSSTTGAYNPECDDIGFYQRTQCHPSTGFCWCVDKHGVEYANTRKRGKPDCDKIVGQSESDERAEFAEEEGDKVGSVGEEEEEDEDDDVESVEGSADRPLDI